jgi:hypothetical protein
MGYRQTTKKSIFHPKERERSKRYAGFKERVLLLSIEAGMPNIGRATKENPPRLSVQVFWKREPKIDFKNVYGAVEDALFYEWDRHVKPGHDSDVEWDSGKEELRVIVELDGGEVNRYTDGTVTGR